MTTIIDNLAIRIDSIGNNKWGISGQEILRHKDHIKIAKNHDITEINSLKKYKVSFKNSEDLLANNKDALSGDIGDYIDLKPNGYSEIIMKMDNNEFKLIVFLQPWARVNFYK